MRIALTTAWNEAYEDIAQVTTPVMHYYALKHGYDFLPLRGKFHLDMERDKSLLSYGDRCKIQIFKDYYNDYDAIAWIDVDTLVTNLGRRLEDILEDRTFLWTYGPSGPLSGFTIARCIPEVHLALHQVLHRAAEDAGPTAPGGRSDQDTMRYFMTMPPFDKVFGGRNLVSCKEAGHCFPFSLYGWGDYAWLGNWEEGDFLWTAPAIPIDKRLEYLSGMRKRVYGD